MRIAIAAGVTAAVIVFGYISGSDREEGTRLGYAIGLAVSTGCIVAGVVGLWAWALA